MPPSTMNPSKNTGNTGNTVRREINQTDTTPMVIDGPRPTVGDDIGEGVGGVSGALAGAALGALGGPVGVILGGIAGALGGWWSGRAISEAAGRYTPDDEQYFRRHYDTSSGRGAGRSFDDVRTLYHFGHVAGQNPEYLGRSFDDVEGTLRQGWTDDLRGRYGDWSAVRDYTREGYLRGSATIPDRLSIH